VRTPFKSAAHFVLTVSVIEETRTILERLPSTPEVTELQRRWHALRTVVHGVVFDEGPSITPLQLVKLTERVAKLGEEVADVQRRLTAKPRAEV
jgi:hypothetical protein